MQQTTALKHRKLADTKTLQEAKKILDALNIGKTSAIRKLVGLDYKMTDDDDKKHTLQEADESAMGKDEKPYSERGGQKNAEEQKVEDETHGNEEARELSAGKSELHGNPSGNPGSDVPTTETPGGKGGQKNANEQKGTSQLGGEGNKENMPYYQMMEQQQPSPDLLNQKVIGLMDPAQGAGLSKVAAEQAAGGDARAQMGFLQEAMKPVLSRIWRDVQSKNEEIVHLKEAIDILKTSKETGRISLMKTTGPGGNLNQETIPGQDPTVNESAKTIDETDFIAKEAFQKDILAQYC